ncbi:MAG: IS200/IS605 family transposase [Candidatus Margulisiibacteriota bacterium]|jgi:putative transposase
MFYHYIFNTYKGKSSLLEKEMRQFLEAEFKQIAQKRGLGLLASNILEEHVHLLVEQEATDSTEYVMKMFKGSSSRAFFLEYPSNRFVDRKLWGRGYFARKISEKDLPKVIQYINEQHDAAGVDKRY